MELETINKLYLELSQIATAKTSKEIVLEKQVADIKMRGKLIQDIFNCEEYCQLPLAIKERIQNFMDRAHHD